MWIFLNKSIHYRPSYFNPKQRTRKEENHDESTTDYLIVVLPPQEDKHGIEEVSILYLFKQYPPSPGRS